MRQRLHPFHHEAESVPDDEDAGRRRRAVAGIDQHALPRLQGRLHAVAEHGDEAQIARRRVRVIAHDLAGQLPFGDDFLAVAGETVAGRGAHIELVDAQHAERRRMLEAEAARSALDPGERIELARLDAFGAEDRHEALREIQGQERLAETVFVMLIARAVFHAERMGDFADRKTGALAQLLQLARDGGGEIGHPAMINACPVRGYTLFPLRLDRF